ncbi:MAG: GNAT family N-acetyltransferase [Limibaculum sp.]
MGVSDQIRTATWADEKPIAALVGLAFAADPYVRWLLPDPYNYLRSNESYVRQFSRPAFANSSAFVIGNMCGAALWLPPGVEADSRPSAALDDELIDPAVLDDLAQLTEESSAYRPLEPHWYLKFIAVDPVKRGRGYGAALMLHALKICDRDQRPAYLESTNAANLSLYKRHGFKVLAKLQIGQSPVRYPMLREPQ